MAALTMAEPQEQTPGNTAVNKPPVLNVLRQRELFDLLTSPPFPNLKQAAEQLGIAAGSAYNLNSQDKAWSESWQARRAEARAELRDSIRQQIENAGPQAVRTILEVMDCDNPAVRLRAADTVLDRTIGKPQESVDITTGGAQLQSNVVFVLPALDDAPDPHMDVIEQDARMLPATTAIDESQATAEDVLDSLPD